MTFHLLKVDVALVSARKGLVLPVLQSEHLARVLGCFAKFCSKGPLTSL
jgi:hypothetical protein